MTAPTSLRYQSGLRPTAGAGCVQAGTASPSPLRAPRGRGRGGCIGQGELTGGRTLHDVTFMVVDLETTGLVPGRDRILEIGAVSARRGTTLDCFQTLVAPGAAVPYAITSLTGITTSMVSAAPSVDDALDRFLAFVGDAVLVGHNLRFDLSFLCAALRSTGRPRLHNPVVDTLTLARRLLPEVPDHRLATLAASFGAGATGLHRALADATATAAVLHGLLTLLRELGVSDLDGLRRFAAASAGSEPGPGPIRVRRSPPPRSHRRGWCPSW